MLKGIIILSTGLLLNTFCVAATDPFNLEGTYTCKGQDTHDGAYAGKLTLSIDEANSDLAKNNVSYHLTFNEQNQTTYNGGAVASEDHLALYFESTTNKDHRGVGIAKIVPGQLAGGTKTTTLDLFYYEPQYQGGRKDYESCVKEEK